MAHPAQRLLTSLGAQLNVTDISHLFSEAAHICGLAVANADPEEKADACVSCGFRPGGGVRETTCPFTTLYWDFVVRHEDALRGDPRFAAQMNELGGINAGDRAELRFRAAAIRLNHGKRPAVSDIRPIA